MLITQLSFATTYYSRTSGGYWNSNSTWSTVGYGNATNTGTFPAGGDFVFIGDGYNIYLNVSSTVSGITVGQGASGILEILDAGTFTVTVAGSLTINNGGKLWYNGNKSRTQKLFVSGNITNNGTMDLYSDVNDVCNMVLNSSVNCTVSGAGTFDLNSVNLFKSSSTSHFLDVQTNSFENGIRDLILSYGTYIHNNSGLYNVVSTTSNPFTIGPNVVVKVPQGSLAFSPSANAVYLQGSLYVNGGTVYIASSAGTNGMLTQQLGAVIPYLEISSGTLIVYGGITYASGSSNDPFSFKMTGGDVLLNCGTTGTSSEPFFITDVAGSAFDMSGGNITLQSSSYGSSNTIDFGVCGTNGTVSSTGGTVVFGNPETASGDNFTFLPFPNVVLPNFEVTGDPSFPITLSASQTGTANFKLLSLYIDVLKTFDMRSLGGASGDSKTMTITSTYDGINALYNDGTFTARTGTVILAGASSQQISGSNKFTFYNFTLNNSSGATLAKNIDVSNQLTMTSGILTTTASNLVTCLANCSSNLGSSSSFVDGYIVNTVASTSTTTKNFPLGKSGAYRPITLTVQHSTSASVTYNASMLNTSARALNYGLPASLTYVSAVRYYIINRSNVANLSNATITLSYGSDDIVTDYSSLRVAHDNGSSSWINLGGAGTANNAGTITSTSFAGFNTLFTLGNPPGGANPLPIELINFNAYRQDDKVLLKWSTASEQNNDYFEIERSNDSKHFSYIDRIKGAGNSNSILNYQVYDKNPLAGINYYRLKQIDFNGTSTYYDIRELNFAEQKEAIKIYPNPSSSTMNMNIGNNEIDLTALHVYDLTGRSIDFELIKKADANIQLKLKNTTAKGVYKVTLQTPQHEWNSTVVVNEE